MLQFLKETLIFILKCFKRPGEMTRKWTTSSTEGRTLSTIWKQDKTLGKSGYRFKWNCLHRCTPDQTKQIKPVLEYGHALSSPKLLICSDLTATFSSWFSFPRATTHLRCSLPKSWQSPAISTQRMSRWVISSSGCLSFSVRTRHPAR